MAGSSNTLIILLVLAMCVSSSSCAMSVIGPFGGLFSGLSSLFSGEAFKPKLKKIGDFKSVACQDCAKQNWTGSIISFKKEVPCSTVKPKC